LQLVPVMHFVTGSTPTQFLFPLMTGLPFISLIGLFPRPHPSLYYIKLGFHENALLIVTMAT